MSEEKPQKQPEDMSIYELLDELVDMSKQQFIIGSGLFISRAQHALASQRKDYIDRRIDACRDEIARRVGN